MEFLTNVIIEARLNKLVNAVSSMSKRDAFSQIENYVNSSDTRVLCLYGLRRTGKTVLMLQSIRERFNNGVGNKTAYIILTKKNNMAQLRHDLDILFDNGYLYVYIDEITFLNDFLDVAAILSDFYTLAGMRLILSGTDSLGFWFANKDELYDRSILIHTSYIAYSEFARLLDINSVDTYIEYGGTLVKDGVSNPFHTKDNLVVYSSTAICGNIQHSLELYKDGEMFGLLWDLYSTNELTSVINRVIEDEHHRFIKRVIDRTFKSHDFGSMREQLLKDPTFKYSAELSNLDSITITEKLKNKLQILNTVERTTTVTQGHIDEIKKYLYALDLFINMDEYSNDAKHNTISILTQTGMRYCQVNELLDILLNENIPFSMKHILKDRLLSCVKGIMLEEIVLLDTAKTLNGSYDVFRLKFMDDGINRGEFDMVIYDKERNICHLYEIKHSSKVAHEQTKHLRNAEFLDYCKYMYGDVISRNVLYLGTNCIVDGIQYLNVEQYLVNITESVIGSMYLFNRRGDK